MQREFNEFINDLLTNKRQNPRSVNVYRKKLSDFVNFIGTNIHFSELTQGKIESFLARLRDNDYSTQTYNLYLSSIKLFIKYLAREHKIMDFSKSFKNIKKRGVETIATEEIITFLAKIENFDEDSKTILLLYILLDLTFDEISHLKKDDINLSEDGKIGIHIKRDKKYQWLYWMTEGSIFGERLKRELSSIRQKSQKYLFENSHGESYTLPNFTYTFKQYKKYINVECKSMLNLKSDILRLKSEIEIDEQLKSIIGRRYKIKQRLARSRNCDIYLVHDTKRKEDVVIKLLLSSENVDQETITNFKNEFLTQKSLDHPLIVKTYDFEYARKIQRYYFTMEYIKMAHIDVIKSIINVKIASSIIFQVVDFLKYIKSKNLTFFDLSPGNILLKIKSHDSVEIKIIDFGLASKEGMDGVKGTGFFVAPEILINKSPSPSSDIYSLGILIYNLVTKNFPFPTGSFDEYLSFIQNGKAIPLSQFMPSIPKKFDAILSKMISFTPMSRYRSLDELQSDIEIFYYDEFLMKPQVSFDLGIREPRFVGRIKEYNLLKNSFNITFKNTSERVEHSIFFISGEFGIGKTRLIEELLNLGNLSSINVDRLSIFSENPILSIIEFCNFRKKIDKNELMIIHGESDYDKSTTLKKISELLTKHISKEPTLLYIDCAHSLCPDLNAVFEFLIEEMAFLQKPVMLIFSFDEELKSSQLFERYNKKSVYVKYIHLERLGREESEELISSSINRLPHNDLLAYLYESCGGNPGYTMHLLKYLFENQILASKGMYAVLKKIPSGKPLKIIDLAYNRLKALPCNLRLIVYCVSVYGQPLTIATLLVILPQIIKDKTRGELIVDIETLKKKNYFRFEIIQAEAEADPSRQKDALKIIHEKNEDYDYSESNEPEAEADLGGAPRRTQIIFAKNEYNGDSDSNMKRDQKYLNIIKLADEYLGEVIDKLIPKREKILCHSVIANNLLSFYGGNAAYRELIARHLLLSNDLMAAIRFYVQIANESLNTGLLEKAKEINEKVLSSMGSIDSREKEQIQRERLMQLGTVDLILGNYKEAEKCFNRIKTEKSDLKTRIEILKKLGDLYNKKGDLNSAEEYFDRAISLAEENNLSSILFDLSIGKTSILISKNRFAEAQRILNDILAKDLLSDKLKMKIYKNLGIINFYENELKGAIDKFFLALDFAAKCDDLHEIFIINNNIGLIFSQQSKFDEALKWYESGLKVAEKKSLVLEKANILQNLGSCYLRMGKLGDTLRCYEKSFDIYRILDKPREIELATFNMGLVYLELGDNEMATKYAEESLKLGEGRGEHVIGYNYSLFGDIFFSRNDFETALSWYKRASEIFGRLKINQALSESLLSMAQCEIELGNQHQPEAEPNLGVASKHAQNKFVKNEHIDNSKSNSYLKSAIEHSENDNKILVEATILYAKDAIRQNNPIIAKENLDKIENINVDNLPYGTKLSFYETFTRFHAYSGNKERVSDYYAKLDSLINFLFANIPESMHSSYTNNPRIRTSRELLYDLRIREEGFTDKNKLERLIEITMSLTSCMDIGGLINIILDNAILFSGAKRGILLYNEGGELKIAKARNFSKEDISLYIPDISRTILSKIRESEKIIHIENASETFASKESVEKARLKSVITFPIIVQNKIFGAVYLDDPTRVAAFNNIDTRLMNAFAKQISIAISNSLTLSKLEGENKNLDERIKGLLSELSEKEEKLEMITETLLVKERRESAAYDFGNIITRSERMLKIFETIERVKDSDFHILITGESGTGKELIARAIHLAGNRSKSPFFAENCGSFTETLLESELFGYVRGAFTGATNDRRGLFELAEDGTIFLDEIGEMKCETQKRFLRVIQEREVRRVGGDKAIKINARVICATNRDLSKMITEGLFREDLYYRIGVIEIDVPPLRERKEDLPLLINHFIKKYGRGETREFSKGLIEILKKHDWPGNVRELENDVVRLLTLSDKMIVDEEDFFENAMVNAKMR